MVALVPGPGQVDRDPGCDGLVVAVAQAGQERGVEAGAFADAAGPDGGGGLAEGVAGLPGPDLGYRIDGVGVAGVPIEVGEALLDASEPGVVAEVAAVVVADQDPGETVQDPEPGDRRLGAVARGAVPDEVRAAGSRSLLRWWPRWSAGRGSRQCRARPMPSARP